MTVLGKPSWRAHIRQRRPLRHGFPARDSVGFVVKKMPKDTAELDRVYGIKPPPARPLPEHDSQKIIAVLENQVADLQKQLQLPIASFSRI